MTIKWIKKPQIKQEWKQSGNENQKMGQEPDGIKGTRMGTKLDLRMGTK